MNWPKVLANALHFSSFMLLFTAIKEVLKRGIHWIRTVGVTA